MTSTKQWITGRWMSKSGKVVLQKTIQYSQTPQSPKINRIKWTIQKNATLPSTLRFTKPYEAVIFHSCSQHEGGMQIIERCMFLAQAPLRSLTIRIQQRLLSLSQGAPLSLPYSTDTTTMRQQKQIRNWVDKLTLQLTLAYPSWTTSQPHRLVGEMEKWH